MLGRVAHLFLVVMALFSGLSVQADDTSLHSSIVQRCLTITKGLAERGILDPRAAAVERYQAAKSGLDAINQEFVDARLVHIIERLSGEVKGDDGQAVASWEWSELGVNWMMHRDSRRTWNTSIAWVREHFFFLSPESQNRYVEFLIESFDSEEFGGIAIHEARELQLSFLNIRRQNAEDRTSISLAERRLNQVLKPPSETDLSVIFRDDISYRLPH